MTPSVQGPVREVSVACIAVGLSTKRSPDGGSEDGDGSGSLWQALLSGQLVLPVSLHGVHVRLAPAPPKPAAAAASPAEATPAADGAPAGRPKSGRKGGRQLRGPLLALAHLPLNVESVTLLDEVIFFSEAGVAAWEGVQDGSRMGQLLQRQRWGRCCTRGCCDGRRLHHQWHASAASRLDTPLQAALP